MGRRSSSISSSSGCSSSSSSRKTSSSLLIRTSVVTLLVVVLSSCQWLSVVAVDGEQQVGASGGTWIVLLENAGIASMHTAITHFNTAIFIDRTLVGPSKLPLPNGVCRNDRTDPILKHECTARSAMFDLATNTIRPLNVLTNTWCSSGQFFPDGTMVHTGGDTTGNKVIRRLVPCPASGTCDWVESTTEFLTNGRWYASNQLLPDGRQIVIGGRDGQTYEFVPKRTPGEGSFPLQLLQETNDNQNDNFYPFVHLLPSGNLFIFANQKSIILNYNTGAVVQTFPDLPGGPRNYPSAGSTAMLPLDFADGFTKVEVLICGGAAAGAYRRNGGNLPAQQTCGRIEVTAPNPSWSMETMPFRRCMGDMIILPYGDIVILNGAQNGSQGWGFASEPILNPIIYAINASPNKRFQILTPTTIPRVYHSTANLLPDGRILVAGSNSHQFDTFTGVLPTELRVEAFSPPYLDSSLNSLRPQIVFAPTSINYGQIFQVDFRVTTRKDPFQLRLSSSPFSTHTYAHGQRQLNLRLTGPVTGSVASGFSVKVSAPPTAVLAPPSYYMLFPVQAGVPGKAVWIQLVTSKLLEE